MAERTMEENCQNTNVKCLIPTTNIYEALSSYIEESDINVSCETSEDAQNLPIEVIMDSHGKFLDPRWMYKNKELRITILVEGKKNIKGAIEQIQKEKSPKHLIIGVGRNDLANEDPEDVALKFRNLVSVKPKSSIIHILPIFEKCGDRAYNVKASVTNRKLEDICEETGVHFIKMNKISSDSPQNYTRDGVHFNNTGRKNLAIMIKQNLNPHFGMKPYDQYQKQSQRQENYQEQHHQNSKREYPQRKQHHNQWQTNEEKRWYNKKNTQHTSDRPHQNNNPKQIHQQKSPWYQSTQVKTSR